jgi:membrane protein
LIVLTVFRAWLERIVQMEGLDRAVVLGAQAFAALFPLLIVYTALVDPGGSDGFAERVIDRLELTGAAADSLRRAFEPPPDVEGGVTIVGLLVLVVSALSFARAMQRLYERAWKLPPRGIRASGWGLLWLAALVLFLTVRQIVDRELSGPTDVIVSVAAGTLLWLGTPFLLLARRERWQALLPGALITAIAMTALAVVIALFGTRTFTSAASEYGLIGVAFALMGWLIAAGMVIMAAAALGAVTAELAGLRRPAANRA